MTARKTTKGEPAPITLDAARQALQLLSAADRSTRVRMGEALKDEFGDAAFEVFDAWYSTHDRYTLGESKRAWRSFGKGGGKACRIATLIYETRAAGFRWNGVHQDKRSESEIVVRHQERAARRLALEAEAREAQASAALRAEAIWNAAAPAPADHPYLERKRIQPHVARWVPEWVKEWQHPETGEIRQFRYPDALLIPIWSGPGKLASLQAILAERLIGRKGDKRDKDYFAGGRKDGCYCTLGRVKPETPVVVICEGYATGASIHEATALPVLVAFDAGNMAPVATALRAKLPGAKILIAADNDQWHDDGRNPGVEAATSAAKACAGLMVVPTFDAEHADTRPTDFNDVSLLQGSGAVRRAIAEALDPPAPAVEAREPAPEPIGTGAPPATPDEAEPALDLQGNPYFVILGFDHSTYYFFSLQKMQLVVMGKGDFTSTGLIGLAPLQWWEMHFESKTGFNIAAATNFLIGVAVQRGIYDPSRIRGRGAWEDEGRIVFHHGSHLSVDGVETGIAKLRSHYTYELSRALPRPDETPLRSDEGEELLDLAAKFRWSMSGSAALLAGWVALAPVCGALKWRPHLWMTGGAGSGKTTVLTEFVHYLLGGIDVYSHGNSSEAGIRQELRSDARPVAMDESESNEEKDATRIQSILSMIRQSSSQNGAKTFKGTAGGEALSFEIRSMFILASVQVALKQKADIDRLTVLSLRSMTPEESAGAGEEWRRLRDALHVIRRDETLPARLLRRAINLLPVTLKNIVTFSDAAADKFGSQRDGDQYGTLLAGAWSLIAEVEATREDAMEMINRYDWSEHREQAESSEAQKAMSALMGAHIRTVGGVDVTVFELVSAACGNKVEGVDLTAERANAFISRYGMRVKDERLLLSNTSQELRRLMHGSGFEADLRGVMLRVKGADKNGNKPVRFHGVTDKCVSIPLAPIVGKVVVQDDDDSQPF